ncbi:MAG: glycosyltransferase [Pseudomonadota bacterium]
MSTIREIARRPTLSTALALDLVKRTRATEVTENADEIERGIRTRVDPQKRHGFDLAVRIMRLGPYAASLRSNRPHCARRSLSDAAMLARALVDAGKARLAVRYVRFCARRWPRANWIATVMASALYRSGDPEAALAYLEVHRSPASNRDIEVSRQMVLLNMGELQRALDLFHALSSKPNPPMITPAILQAELSLGNLEAARRLLQQSSENPGQALVNIPQFRATQNGQLMTELEVCHRMQNDGVKPYDPRLVSSFFAPARAVLSNWVVRQAKRPNCDEPSRVPKKIFQYWDKVDVPSELVQVMAHWKDVPGWAYVRFHRNQALAWLRDVWGDDHVRAFRMARQAAEGADFFRLCLLAAEGGVYADADDMLIGAPDDLLALGPGLVLFREPHGSVANNLIAAPPQHPVMTRAVEMACASMLARENDNVWTKTGPGLLTRAAALHVLENPIQAEGDMTLLPQHKMYPVVQPHLRMPYKATQAYWNSDRTTGNTDLQAALQLFLTSTSGNTVHRTAGC